jgi:glycerophosphoryl diester phosphodiesterase
MKIIGHRGTRGTELENSLASIRAALQLDLDAIEFDIHHTSDGVLMVIHDSTTARVADQVVRISDVTYAELSKIQLRNGQHIPTLKEVLKLAGSHPLYIDIKDTGSAEPLVRLLKDYPEADITFVSFLPAELKRIRELLPHAHTYVYFRKREYLVPRPFKMFHTAERIDATGISIDKLFLNPVLYTLARRRGLNMYVYSIGSLTFARLLARFYPAVDLCTSHPERLNTHFRPLLEQEAS